MNKRSCLHNKTAKIDWAKQLYQRPLKYQGLVLFYSSEKRADILNGFSQNGWLKYMSASPAKILRHKYRLKCAHQSFAQSTLPKYWQFYSHRAKHQPRQTNIWTMSRVIEVCVNFKWPWCVTFTSGKWTVFVFFLFLFFWFFCCFWHGDLKPGKTVNLTLFCLFVCFRWKYILN